MQRVLIIHGPNLNLLGEREPDVYGALTLSELERQIATWAATHGIDCDFFQSNHEGAIIDRIHDARHEVDGLIINGGAFTHYSYAIHDALVAVDKPTVEVHISNIHAREEWRRTSVTAPAADHVIYGRGARGYEWALHRLVATAAAPARRIAYGPDPSQFGELRLPEGSGPHRVAVLIHGGFWRDVWTLDLMDPMAVALLSAGWAVWNVEYRRVGGTGGWPATANDVGAAIDHLRALAAPHRLDLDDVTVIGHSAGGQLALWSASREAVAEGNEEPLLPSRIVALAPVADLARAFYLDLDDGAAADLLGGSPRDVPERYAAASPLDLVPLDRPQLIVHSEDDAHVPIAMGRDYVAKAAAAGDPATLAEPPGDHFAVLDPESSAFAAVLEWLGVGR